MTRRTRAAPRCYDLSPAQVAAFGVQGYLGPFDCDAPGVAALPERVRASRRGDARSGGAEKPINIGDPHQAIHAVRAVIEHPSIVARVAALLGVAEVRYFQSRYRVKLPAREDPVHWHQDVGPRSGGCYSDGRPIPSLTIWLSIDGARRESGCVQVLPGTHGRPLGDWRMGYDAGIEPTGHLGQLDLSGAVALEAGACQFHVFHSWIVHISGPNVSRRPRTGLVARFVHPEDAVDPAIDYYACRVG